MTLFKRLAKAPDFLRIRAWTDGKVDRFRGRVYWPIAMEVMPYSLMHFWCMIEVSDAVRHKAQQGAWQPSRAFALKSATPTNLRVRVRARCNGSAPVSSTSAHTPIDCSPFLLFKCPLFHTHMHRSRRTPPTLCAYWRRTCATTCSPHSSPLAMRTGRR